jgi:cell volume regulation protein A
VWELRLPPGSVVSVIVRDEQPLVPDGRTTLRAGDQLLLIVPSRARRQVERRLLAVHRAGRLASWLGERGEPDPRPTGARRSPILRWLRTVAMRAADRRDDRSSSRPVVERSPPEAPVHSESRVGQGR